MEAAAWFNLRKLVGGRIAPAFQEEALAEIELQLEAIPMESTKTGERRAIFDRLEAWKQPGVCSQMSIGKSQNTGIIQTGLFGALGG